MCQYGFQTGNDVQTSLLGIEGSHPLWQQQHMANYTVPRTTKGQTSGHLLRVIITLETST